MASPEQSDLMRSGGAAGSVQAGDGDARDTSAESSIRSWKKRSGSIDSLRAGSTGSASGRRGHARIIRPGKGDGEAMVKYPWQFAGWGEIQRHTIREPRDDSTTFIDLADDKLNTNSVDGFADASRGLLSETRGRTTQGGSSCSCFGYALPCGKGSEPSTSEEDDEQSRRKRREETEHKKLGQLLATAIAGNDITSSCLYVAGICTAVSGKLAPICLVLVVILLYLFRSVYGEVGSALPLNGGAYNVLLNTTTKVTASLAACLTLLSYTATAVVSASEATEYFIEVLLFFSPDLSSTADWWVTYSGPPVVLGIFAALNMIGISESASVAALIFIAHLVTLTVLVGTCTVYLFSSGFDVLSTNWDYPSVNGSYALDLWYGFSAALLGVSGFETSSNYIEEQKPGVFPKTLRNMWIAVAFFNPVISFLSLCIINIDDIVNNPEDQDDLLSLMGQEAGGSWLSVWVSIDASIVLAGAVLTSYVGVIGLAKRMALDRCLPQVVLAENSICHTNHWLILGFFVVTVSLFAAVQGDVKTLSSVYSIAFLSVMSLFAIGNMLLKYKRASLPRSIHAWWSTVILGLIGVLIGLVGNVASDVESLAWFSLYFGATVVVVGVMFARAFFLSVMYSFLERATFCTAFADRVASVIGGILRQEIIFFAKSDRLHVLNKALLYVRDNELASTVKIVHVFESDEHIPPRLEANVALLDEMYPKLRVDLILVHASFTPPTVDRISTLLDIPKNFMFVSCPDDRFPHEIADFGGIRLITG